MRFHCGISFSWRSIKKFLIPILLGLLAFFGFNFIYDNKSNIPLGFIQAYAFENETEYIPDEIEDSYYYYSYLMAQEQENITHKPIHDKIYWFDDNTTTYGVLSSIYILLFLYCICMVVLRILTIIKNTRW